jgi:hypothetical protein
MIYTIDNIKFIKNGSTVNIKVEDLTVDVFTDYEIKTEKQFEKACKEYFKRESL